MTQKILKELLSYDSETGLFKWIVNRNHLAKTGDIAGGIRKATGYRVIFVNGKSYQAHRLVWFYIHGKFPKHELDHINHNRHDNRLCNLREVMHAENGRNRIRQKNNKSGINGVCWHKAAKKWVAAIGVNGCKTRLGFFSNISEAKQAREQAEKKYKYHHNHGKAFV